MKKFIFKISALMVVLSFVLAAPALAHVHPTVPNECALGAGAGNTAAPKNSTNATPPLPGLILNNTPAAVDGSAQGPGVGPATANCNNA